MKQIGIVMGLLLLMSMVFAGAGDIGSIDTIKSTSDYIKTYDVASKTATITTKELIPVASIKLLTPLDNVVSSGYNMVAEFEVSGEISTADFLNKLYFYDLKAGGKNTSIVYDLRIPVEYTVKEDVIEQVCKLDKNGDNICDYKVVGSKDVKKIRYDLLTDKSLGKEKKVISIWTTVGFFDKVEWIPEVYGTLINEWTTWSGPNDTNLVSWYKLDENTGTRMVNSRNTANSGTIVGANYTIGTPGKIGNAYSSYGTSTYVDLNTQALNGSTNGAIAVWVKPTANGIVLNDGILCSRSGGTLSGFLMQDVNKPYAFFNVGALDSPAAPNINDGQWHFLVATQDGSLRKIYIDGQERTSAVASAWTVNANWILGFESSTATRVFDGNLDEVSIWNKGLSSADVNALYRSGTGVTYCGAGYNQLFDTTCNIGLDIDFNVYRAGTTTLLNNVDMDCNVDALDLNNKQAPFTQSFSDGNIYSCNFSVFQGYDVNTVVVYADTAKTMKIYLTDSNAPSTTIAGNNTAWTTSNGSITFTSTDLNGSGVANTKYSIDGGVVTTYSGAIAITTDGNHTIDYNSTDNAGNKETTIRKYYALDTTAPTVGATTTASYTIVGTQIWGTGNIVGGVAADATSGIDTTSCQYTMDNGVNWSAGSWSVDHCYKNGVPIAAGLTYTFNTRVKNNAGTYGTGTATVAYTADNVAPSVGVTTLTGFTTYLTWINGSGNVVGGLATDAVSGIDTATCEIQLSIGDGWVTAGTWSVNHCTYGLFGPVNDGISYTFNTRVKDAATNQGTGTAAATYLGDTVGPTTTDNSVPNYNTNPTVTVTGNDGAGSGVKAIWYCVDQINTCTPNILGTSYTSAVPNGFSQIFYMRYVGMDYFDINGATNSTGLITVNRTTTTVYPDNNSNTGNWLSMTNLFAEGLFGFDYTTLGIFCLLACAIMAFIFRINALVAILMSIPLTYAFFVLAGGAGGILLTILILEIIALAVKIAMSLMNVGNQGAA